MAGLTGALLTLLRWQWIAYWRRILRGGTAARSNLIVLALLTTAGFARYLTFLRDVAKQTATGNTALLELTLAGLLLLALQPGWDAAGLALGSRDMARFPLAPIVRFGLRVLSRFVAPLSWVLFAACISALWPIAALAHQGIASAVYLTLMLAAFAAGLALADYSQTAAGRRIVGVGWVVIVLCVAGAWLSGVQQLPPLPSYWVAMAGNGNWIAVIASAALACFGLALAYLSLPWMLGHTPPGERSGQAHSASAMTLLGRELRQQTKLIEVRTAWFISAALAFYLITADHAEPDALRVMLGLLSFLAIGVAMNSFGLDGVAGLDRFLLWPVTSARIFTEKNKAFLMIVLGPTLPLALLAGHRFGWREGISDALEAAAIAFAMLAWGNITSVRHPENISTTSGGSVLDQMVGLAAVAIPTAVSIGILRTMPQAAPLCLLGQVASSALLYAASLRYCARYFANYHEQIRRLLT